VTRLRALVLEDELPARRLLVRLIEETGLGEVIAAVTTVAEALRVLHSTAVDVVFVDIRLSGGESGLDLIHAFAGREREDRVARGKGPHPPYFVLATALERHALQAFALGVVDYLLKPLTEERVEHCLQRLAGLLENETGARP
jgi:two-component system, LytTR family, response regulator LytT